MSDEPMTDEQLIAKLNDIAECIWWDWGYEDEHTHGPDRRFIHTAASRLKELSAENERLRAER